MRLLVIAKNEVTWQSSEYMDSHALKGDQDDGGRQVNSSPLFRAAPPVNGNKQK